MRRDRERNIVGRNLTSMILALACLTAGHGAWANQLLNLELTGGVGVTAYNLATDNTTLAPPFVQLQLSYLPVRTGPVNMGPIIGVPVGFFQAEGQDGWDPQVAMRAGWQVYGRPNVDFAWSAAVGADFVFTPEDEGADFVWGLELGGSVAYFILAGLAITGGIRYALFYGVDPVHVVSFQFGFMISHEVVR